jgi:hypothetical protein
MQFPLVIGTRSATRVGVPLERLILSSALRKQQTAYSPSQLPRPPNEGLLLPTGMSRIARSYAAVNKLDDNSDRLILQVMCENASVPAVGCRLSAVG